MKTITVIITNYKTEHLTRQAVESLLRCYPGQRLIVIDNGSQDGSTEYIKSLAAMPNVVVVLSNINMGHGPALHQGMVSILWTTPYAFLMDSDCIVTMGGFLETMYSWFVYEPNLYAVGWKRCVDKYSGISTDDNQCGKEGFCWYIHPHAMMIDVHKYFQLEPFDNDGAPCLKNMRDATDHGFLLEAFPVENYVTHLVAGTRRMWDGAWDIGNSQPTREWKANEYYPI